MRYSIGDILEFKIGSIETDKGEVKFIEEDFNESTEKKIASRCNKLAGIEKNNYLNSYWHSFFNLNFILASSSLASNGFVI